jgi:hypothetical protein
VQARVANDEFQGHRPSGRPHRQRDAAMHDRSALVPMHAHFAPVAAAS